MNHIATFVLFCLIFLNSALAQVYHPMPTGMAEWSSTNTWYDPFVPNNITNIDQQYVTQDGDTTIQGTIYHRIYIKSNLSSPDVYYGGIREDSTKTVWFRPAADTVEFLLYKWGMNVGDMVTAGDTTAWGRIDYQVNAIDSIMIAGQNHARYRMDGGHALGDEFWIEGMGSTKGILFPYAEQEFENEWNLECFLVDSMSVYPDHLAGYSYCFGLVNADASEAPMSPKLTFWPNPVNHQLNLKWENGLGTVNLKIYSVQGDLKYSGTLEKSGEKILDTDEWPAGIYLMRWVDGECESTQKLVIHR